jgi:hypothetical protein
MAISRKQPHDFILPARCCHALPGWREGNHLTDLELVTCHSCLLALSARIVGAPQPRRARLAVRSRAAGLSGPGRGPGKSPRFSPCQCGGAEYQNPAALALGATAISCQALNDRQRESSGPAGARLGDAEYIARGENDRAGFGLYWGRRFEPSACSVLRIGVLRPRCEKSVNVCAFRRPGLAGCAELSIRSATQVTRCLETPRVSWVVGWCFEALVGGRFRESARSSFTRLERRKSLNRAVTPYFMLRRTSQTRRKPEGHPQN